jgi:hypothetical protein
MNYISREVRLLQTTENTDLLLKMYVRRRAVTLQEDVLLLSVELTQV